MQRTAQALFMIRFMLIIPNLLCACTQNPKSRAMQYQPSSPASHKAATVLKSRA